MQIQMVLFTIGYTANNALISLKKIPKWSKSYLLLSLQGPKPIFIFLTVEVFILLTKFTLMIKSFDIYKFLDSHVGANRVKSDWP